MRRQSAATPCPGPMLNSLHRRDSVFSNADDTTTTLEFTSAFGGSLRNTKPRRRQTGTRRNDGALDFAIHEDEEVPANTSGFKSSLTQPPRRNVVSHNSSLPPQRPKHRVSFVPQVEEPVVIASNSSQAAPRLAVAPRRPSIAADKAPPMLSTLPEDTTFSLGESKSMFKPARRQTLYIPNDDTTMPSMYMGIFSPIKDLDVRMAEQTDIGDEFTGIAAQMAKKRGPRRSMMRMSPKRGALQTQVRPVQETASVEDRLGQGGGKENLPPGYSVTASVTVQKPALVVKRRATMVMPPVDHSIPDVACKARVSRLYEPTTSSMGRVQDKKSGSDRQVSKPSWNGGPRVKKEQPTYVKPASPEARPLAAPVEQNQRKNSVPSRFVVPSIKSERISQEYPILVDDIPNPAMYEHNWLGHQEIALTQLINTLFNSSTPTEYLDEAMLRIRLLNLFGSAQNAILQKRVQASLLYGALSVPADILKSRGRLDSDLGKRRAFTNLWLSTYNLQILKPALEVVVGRQCGSSPAGSPTQRRSIDGSNGVSRSSLQRFIETFLIRNEDASPDRDSTDRNSWSYQRTLLRSLMLIKILDDAKTTIHVHGCLFQDSSPFKNSTDVVQALFQMLNPSAGDPTRALNHLGYTVAHSQHALAEYSYRITNLAVDLRDGVRLTRLVELLLYPSAAHMLEHAHDADATTMVLLPTGETLSLIDGQGEWPLSQHLKLPCIGRATKLCNVQIALSALRGVKGLEGLATDITAEDLVDGYREKTVRLLWGLTSKWGLGGLVDWDDVEREVKRLCRDDYASVDEDFFDILDEAEEGYARYKTLLKSWAQAIASKRGIVVKNLTTSFADGRAFEAIVDEYEGYLKNEIGERKPRSLSERLKDLGCSEQFCGLFKTSGVAHQTHIFDRDFVLAALTFLCSRLMGPSKSVRAAATIQRAWRRRWSKVLARRKATVKCIAEACAQAARERGSLAPDLRRDGDPEHEAEMAVVVPLDGQEAHRDDTSLQAVDDDIWLNL